MDLLRRIFAAFLAFLQMLLMNLGIIKPERLYSEVTPMERTIVSPDLPDENEFTPTAEYAAAVRNLIRAVYTDSTRSGIAIGNSQVQLTHSLTGESKNASLKNQNGGVFFEDSLRTFAVNQSGKKSWFEDSKDNARVNTIRLGEYYYDTHIRDLSQGSFKVDKDFHVYGDKLYAEFSLLSAEPTTALSEFGSEIKLPADKVTALEIKDKNGVHTSLDSVDSASVEYAAFNVESAGVLGFILPCDGTTASLSVENSDGYYVINLLAAFEPGTGINNNNEEGGYALNKVTVGFRIFTGDNGDLEGVRRASEEEHNPLTVRIISSNAEAAYAGYDSLRGTYNINLNGMAFTPAYNAPDLHYTFTAEISGDSDGRTVYFRTTENTGCLEASVLMTEDSVLLPVDVQVSKNFQGDGGEPFYSPIDRKYGDGFFPLCVGAEPMTFKVINLYQNWGKTPIKQLSSIEFHTSYYHMSTGTTESNCIAPYFVFEKDGWTLPDFRNRSGGMWSTQPQFNSVGILKFVSYRDKSVKEPVYAELQGSVIDSCGMSYSDITSKYLSDSGKFSYTLRHVEFPQTDENRTMYTVNIDFNDDISFKDFKKDFDLFYFDGRFVTFNKLDYLNEENKPVTADVTSRGKPVYYTLGSEAPFMGLYNVTAETDYRIDECFGCNFALIVKNSSITRGGAQEKIPFVLRDTSDKDKTVVALTLDAKELSFKKGDSIKMDIILLPWGTGRETNDSNVLRVREDSVLSPLTVSAKVGTVVDDAYLPVVKAENGTAEFTLSGGANNVAVRVDGLGSMFKPEIMIDDGGEWKPFDLASANGYDGYTVRAAADGTYSFSFTVTMPEDGGDITLKVSQ